MKQLMSVVLLLCVSVVSRSQFSDNKIWTKELGFSINAMNCNTDIGGQTVDVKSFRPGGGIYAAVLYRQMAGVRLEGTIGQVTASDARPGARNIRKRNLDFTSTIKEVSLLAEVHPLNIFSKEHTTPALSPYLLAGVGYFGFDPKTKLDGQWIYLQPLHTEGEGFPETGRPNYKLSGINFPVGGGLQYNISERLVLRGEAVYRFLNTDYLDDVSTTYIDPNLFDKYLSPDNAILAKRLADRSYAIPEEGTRTPGSIRGSTKKDAYYSVNIKLGIRLAKSSGSGRTSGRKAQGCFAF
ncbi:hypothetical protein FC093_11140 [Ilyomonas limi]|uniref:DUF6089 domain-containing protein n=1 Tax=Ilyomonas limi TaxID=2575867 RepID=A0A4V5UUD6_9BACT|nr:DUF6089 family protein [Ilyomonas limi]TKK68663.1 hypothetical protein FC093_11140 [Ilyomonas limi]